jgi:hypothetical protein
MRGRGPGLGVNVDRLYAARGGFPQPAHVAAAFAGQAFIADRVCGIASAMKAIILEMIERTFLEAAAIRAQFGLKTPDTLHWA